MDSRRHQFTAAANERLGKTYGFRSVFRAYADFKFNCVIGKGLQIVGARQKGRESAIDAPIIFRKTGKLASHAGMGLGDFSCVFENVGLRGVVRGYVGGASRSFRKCA